MPERTRHTYRDPRRLDPMRAPLSDYVVVDLETTGLDVKTGAMPIEIGAVRVTNGHRADTFETLINPGAIIPWEVTQLTGITNRMLIGQPDVIQTTRMFDRWLHTGTVVMAHNAPFDIGFLDMMASLAGTTFDHPWTDTLEMARRLHPMRLRHRVTDLIVYYGIADNEAHRALSDAIQEQQVYEAMKKETFGKEPEH
ncbi:3'-5' exonuclease [Bifidobacterium bifidum]|nr:3'-5' exonuclease [Bifidobacterium bifidum]